MSHVSLVTAALHRLDPSVFTGILLGGSRPPGDLPRNVVTTYGMTETGSGVVYDGVPLDDVEVAIAHFDDDAAMTTTGAAAAAARTAETARSSSAPPCSCAATGTGRRDVSTGPDGTPTWFATGDAGYLTEDGTLSVVGRIAEMITTGGENVWPDEVERVLSTNQNVAEVAVWKRPDPEWGERVVAWIVATGDLPHVERIEGARRHHDRPLGGSEGSGIHSGATPDPLGQGHAPRPELSRSGSGRRTLGQILEDRAQFPAHLPRVAGHLADAFPGRIERVPGLKERHPKAPSPRHGHDHPWFPYLP